MSLFYDTPMFRILALYLDFEGAKNLPVLKVLIQGFGGCWRFQTEVWHLDLDFYRVFDTPIFWIGALFWRCKEHPMFFTSLFGALTGAGGSWLGFCLFIATPTLQFLALYFHFEGAKKIKSLKSWFGALMGAGGSQFRLCILILNLIWWLVFDTPIFKFSALYLHFEGAKNIHVL